VEAPDAEIIVDVYEKSDYSSSDRVKAVARFARVKSNILIRRTSKRDRFRWEQSVVWPPNQIPFNVSNVMAPEIFSRDLLSQ
jgi:hypothetical protein